MTITTQTETIGVWVRLLILPNHPRSGKPPSREKALDISDAEKRYSQYSACVSVQSGLHCENRYEADKGPQNHGSGFALSSTVPFHTNSQYADTEFPERHYQFVLLNGVHQLQQPGYRQRRYTAQC